MNTTTMQTVLLNAHATPLQITEVTRPVAGPGQVLVRIRASGLNPLDAKIRAGKAGHAQAQLPAVLGIDMAGVVEAVGAGVTGFNIGDEVYGMTGGVGSVQGSLAQFAAVDADLLAHKPSNIDMRDAAALPLIFITAWEGLVDRAHIHDGQKVLVHGGAGGVGISPCRSPSPSAPTSMPPARPNNATSSPATAPPSSTIAPRQWKNMCSNIPMAKVLTSSTTPSAALHWMHPSSRHAVITVTSSAVSAGAPMHWRRCRSALRLTRASLH